MGRSDFAMGSGSRGAGWKPILGRGGFGCRMKAGFGFRSSEAKAAFGAKLPGGLTDLGRLRFHSFNEAETLKSPDF